MDDVLARYGWNPFFAEAFAHRKGKGLVPGRIGVDYGQDYLVLTADGEVRVEVPGKLRRAIGKGEEPQPAVGDWVVVEARKGDRRGVLVGTLPRKTKLSRKIAGRTTEEQVVAANVDVVFLVQALTGDLNPRRLERNLTLAYESGARPVVVLTKADLCPDREAALASIAAVTKQADLHVISNRTGEGLEQLDRHLQPDSTLVLVGSSGVGKSTLVNRWLGTEAMLTREVGAAGKGRHTTTHRELFRLASGALVIDTPGVRELALWEGEAGLAEAFPDVLELAATCRFSDCKHGGEPGCEVERAVAEGRLPAERHAAYRKLAAEIEENERKQAERNRRSPRRR